MRAIRLARLVLGVTCVLASCKACDGGSPDFDECVKISTLEGPRYDCDTRQKYARCVAHLLENRLSWCRYSGPHNTDYFPVEADLFDVRRATVGEEAWIREQCPQRDLSVGVAGLSATPDILVCPDNRIAQCLAYQRGGSPFACVAESAGLMEFGLLSRHENTLQVDLANDAYEQSGTQRGAVWARFATPPRPESERSCDPDLCGVEFCTRSCIDMQMRKVIVALGEIPVGGLFAFWRPDQQEGCADSNRDPSFCDCYLGSPVGVGLRNDDQEIESEICREVARLRGVTNASFPLGWSHPGRIEGWYCYTNPFSTLEGGTVGCGRDCAFVTPGTFFAVPYDLTCAVTGLPPCPDDAMAGNHHPGKASPGQLGKVDELRLCAGRNDWFEVELCPGGTLTAAVTSNANNARVAIFLDEPAEPGEVLPVQEAALEASYTSPAGGTVYARVVLAEGFEATYSLTLSVSGCEGGDGAPDGGLDGATPDGPAPDSGVYLLSCSGASAATGLDPNSLPAGVSWDRFLSDLDGWQAGNAGGEEDVVRHVSSFVDGWVKLDGSDFGVADQEPNSWISKQVVLGATATELSFDTRAHATVGDDGALRVRLKREATGQFVTLIDWEIIQGVADDSVWTCRSLDISSFAGEMVTIYFEQNDDGNGSDEARYVDNVVIR